VVASIYVGHRVYVSKVIVFLLSHDCTLVAKHDEQSDTIMVAGEVHLRDDSHPDGGYWVCEISHIKPKFQAARDWLQY